MLETNLNLNLADLKADYLEEIKQAELDVMLTIEEFPLDSITSEALKNFALKKVADLEDYFNDILFNVLDGAKEIERLLLTEAEDDTLQRIWKFV